MTVAMDEASAVEALSQRIDPAAGSRLSVDSWNGIPFLEAKLPGAFRALFTTRIGGESAAPYSTLNLSPRTEDSVSSVRANRGRISEAVSSIGAPRDSGNRREYRLISPLQVHGVRVVGAAEYVAQCDSAPRGETPEAPCDGLTLHPELDRGLAALLLYADCVPVVMVGEVDMAVVHAGWRGLVDGVIQRGAQAMTGPPGMAVIGPSIGPCCFGVSPDVAGVFADRFGAGVVVDEQGGPRVDLWAAASVALSELGVPQRQIVNPRLCTRCNRDLFYSYRGDGRVTGRHGCLAWTVDGS